MAMTKRMLAINEDVHAALKKRENPKKGLRIGAISDKILRRALGLKAIVPILASVVALGLVFGGLVYIASAQAPDVAPSAPPATQVTPPLPTDMALAISEAWGDLQAAYIALQDTPQSKAMVAAQQAYAALVAKAQAAQGIPQDCQPKKGQWVHQTAQNAPVTPCVLPAKPDAKK